MPTNTPHPPVAIIGASALFPESAGTAPFWQNILDGTDLIGDVPPSHWLADDYYDPEPGDADKTYCKRGGFLPDVDFDPVEYGIPPNVIPATDTTQLLALVVARQVLEDAYSTQFQDVDKSKMSVILGVTAGQEMLIQAAARLQRPQWQAALREHGLPENDVQAICDRIADKYTPWQESTFPGLLGNVVAGRIANRFDLGGTNCITDAACASSLSALSMGLDELYLGHSDVVLTGGVDCFNNIFMYMCFTKTPALSESGDCRPFSDRADGTLLGEGLGMFALKRLEDAENDGDQIYAVIRGLGSSSDGRSLSVYAPLPEGQAKALKRAQERAGVDPETIELVEAHGTATRAGDVAEFQGLCHAFTPDVGDDDGETSRPWCALGSIKSQVGHTKAAAGAASLFKATMALHHGVLPPTIKVDRPSSKLDVDDSPFYVNTEARPWIRGSDHPRRAGISSFGFGGSNFHVVVEEYTGPGKRPPRKRVLPAELFTYSAATRGELVSELRSVLDDLSDLPEKPGDRRQLLAHVAHAAHQSFDAGDDHRLAFTVADLDELRTNIERATERIDGGEFDLPGGLSYRNETRSCGDVGFLFPGQGSQYVSMGAELAMHFDTARRVWDEAADLDFDLAARVFPPPAFDDETRRAQREELTATEWAQPAIGADSAAKLALLKALGVEPTAVAGHSYGEITALYAAGAFDRAAMLRIARHRGELMAEASESTDGAMTAVRADADTIAEFLDGEDVTIANDNGPHQVVVSGPTDAVEAAETALSDEGCDFTRLPVDTAFHSPVVADATEPFAEFLGGVDVDKPELSVYANATAAPYSDDAIRSTLPSQIENPVRFAEIVAAMHDDGVDTFIEVGPGDVLTGLATRCLEGSDVHTVAVDRRRASDVTAFFAALARLSALGVELDFSALWEGYAEPEDPREHELSKFTVTINGANVDRPYPPPEGPEAVPTPNPPAAEEAPQMNGTSPSPSLSGSPSLNGKAPDHGAFMSDSSDYTNGRAQTPPSYSRANGAAPEANGRSPRQSAPQPPQPNSPQSPQPTPPRDPESARAFAEYQRSLAESHQAYLRMMEESVSKAQMAYMQAMEASFRQWCGGDGDQRKTPMGPAGSLPADEPGESKYQRGAPPTVASTSSADGLAGRGPQEYSSRPSPEEPPAPATPPNTQPPAPSTSISEVFLEITAQKTGYPPDMLDDSMALEADLGIDSIKRVEILSAVQEKVPSLPELDPNEMASLKTVGEIVDYLQRNTDAAPPQPNGAASPQTKPAPTPATTTEPPSNTQHPAPSTRSSPPNTQHPAPSTSISTVFLDITAQKTGYPPDMLDHSMALEADLGIDSIKRVEILSAVQEKVPSLPELDPNEMASLKTVGEIVEYLESFDSGPPTADPHPGGDRLGKAKAVRPARYEPGLAATKPAGINRLLPSEVTIVDDGGGVGEALAQELADRGYPTTLVDGVDGKSPPSQLVDLRGLATVDDVDEALSIQRDAFRTARTICGDVDTFVVAFDTGGGFGFEGVPDEHRAWLGGLSALAKTADLEWPEAEVQALDVATAGVEPRTVARRIADELVAGGPETEVAIDADGRRRTVVTREVDYPAPDDSPQIDEDDVVVASGGARGVTARCLIELASETGCAIALLGRTPLEEEPDYCRGATTDAELKRVIIEDARDRGEIPNPAEVGDRAKAILKQREIRDTLSGIEAAGASVRYITADVRDRDALTAALDEIRDALGEPTVLVHAAGVLADRRIADKTDEQFDFVFDTKVDGLRALVAGARGLPGRMTTLHTICLFSSVAARTGNVGQVDYAMANETLNKVAARLAGEDLRATSLQWGPWDGGMVGDTLRKHFESRGVSLIDLDAGARAFCSEVTTGTSVEVVLGDGLPETTGTLQTRVSCDATAYPEFAGHSVDGTIVVPMATVTDIFCGLARALRPDADSAILEDVQMLQGIQLPDFGDAGHSAPFTATITPDGDRATLELRDADGTVCYRATAHYSGAPPAPLEAPDNFEDSRWNADTLYTEHLFHGGAFRALEDTEGIGTDTARAEVSAAKSHVAIDAGLQLALVQGTAADGRSNLPTRIGRYADFGLSEAEGSLEVFCVTREVTAHQTVSDFDLRDATGDVVASVRGLEMYFR